MPVLFGISLINYPFLVVLKRVQKRPDGGILPEDKNYCMALLSTIGVLWIVILIIKPLWVIIIMLGTINYGILGFLLHKLKFLRE